VSRESEQRRLAVNLRCSTSSGDYRSESWSWSCSAGGAWSAAGCGCDTAA
jgi:hypothetical protein